MNTQRSACRAISLVVFALTISLCASANTIEVGPITPGTLIDFSGIAVDGTVTHQYSGLLFQNWWGAQAYTLDFSNDSDQRQIANFTSTDSNGRGSAYILFDPGVTSVGFDLVANNGYMYVDVVSNTGTDTFSLLGSRCDQGPACAPTYGFQNVAGINELVFRDAPGNGAFVMDNLIFNGAVTNAPEPTGLVLLGSGLIGIGLKRSFFVSRPRRAQELGDYPRCVTQSSHMPNFGG